MSLIHDLLTSPNEMETQELSEFREWHDPDTNQLVMFIKPEITALGVRAKPALDLIEDRLAGWGCSIKAARLLGPSYLARHRLIDEHYGVISQYSHGASRLGLLPPTAFSHTRIMGAHELLAIRPDLDAARLLSLHTSAANIRLAPGAYAFHYVQGGDDALIVNGFHPAQQAHFYTATTPILVLELASTTSWRKLRSEMVGATDPRNASPGSIRRMLLDQSQHLRIAPIDSMRNGVHLSAGPLEGAEELRRFFSRLPDSAIVAEATNAGQILAALVGAQEADAMLRNQQILKWDAYEETELMDTWRIGDWIHHRMETK